MNPTSPSINTVGPEKIQKVYAWAENIFDHEKEYRIGKSGMKLCDRKMIFVTQAGATFGLLDLPFYPHTLEEGDAWSLALRMFTFMDVVAVLQVSEVWAVD
jgi:hypothetical protein